MTSWRPLTSCEISLTAICVQKSRSAASADIHDTTNSKGDGGTRPLWNFTKTWCFTDRIAHLPLVTRSCHVTRRQTDDCGSLQYSAVVDVGTTAASYWPHVVYTPRPHPTLRPSITFESLSNAFLPRRIVYMQTRIMHINTRHVSVCLSVRLSLRSPIRTFQRTINHYHTISRIKTLTKVAECNGEAKYTLYSERPW